MNCLPDSIYAEPGQSTPESAKNAITALKAAVEDLKEGLIDVLVTAPINKRAMNAEGFGCTGHTEYLQKEFGANDVTMIMVSDQLKVGVVTGHIPLREVPKSISKDAIVGKLRIMKASLERDSAYRIPRLPCLASTPTAETAAFLEMKSRTSSFQP